MLFATTGIVFATLLFASLWMLSIIEAGGAAYPYDVLFVLEWGAFTVVSFYLTLRLPQFQSLLGWTIFLAFYLGILHANLLLLFYRVF